MADGPVEESKPRNRCPVVGVGASAGGLEPLRSFVGALSPNTGFAVIVHQHMSRDQSSHLASLLSDACVLPVEVARHGVVPGSGRVYVVPPGATAELVDGRMVVTANEHRAAALHPIDVLFTSLAEDLGPLAGGVILSGAGSDGAAGLAEIRAAGGTTLAEPAPDAQFPSMPEAALAAGAVARIAPVADIPALLQQTWRHSPPGPHTSGDADLTDTAARLPEVIEVLKARTGRDFSRYKTGTLTRRLHRRVAEQSAGGLASYIERLRVDPDEAKALAQDFLIVVTGLFRDPGAFGRVREMAIPLLTASERRNFRVWCVGCATGQEAHSLAILWRDALMQDGRGRDFQCFGTDIQPRLIEAARRACYASDDIADVPRDLVDDHFEIVAQGYRVRTDIRERCIFAVHDLLADPPFSDIDMISCRNLLIYLRPDAQREALARLHFALRPGGLLMLGSADSTAQGAGLFEPVSEEHRLFRSLDRQGAPFPGIWGERVPPPHADASSRLSAAAVVQNASLSTIAERAYLSGFAQPFMLVSSENDVLYVSASMARFVRPEQGALVASIERLVRREMRAALLSALRESRQLGKTASRHGLELEIDERTCRFDLVVQPAEKGTTLAVLVPCSQDAETAEEGKAPVAETRQTGSLRLELTEARDIIAETEARHADAMQGLIDANETLLAMNEELKSANEELEASGEELESLNEELKTVNDELKASNIELINARNDMNNMLARTEFALVFLDEALNLRLHTEAARELYAIRPADTGRPISDLRAYVDYPDLAADAAEVLRSLTPRSREVLKPDDGRVFIARVSPYRTVDNRVDGTVVSFIEVTERKRAEADLRAQGAVNERQLAELEAFYASTPVGICLLDSELRYLRINRALADLNGAPVGAHIGRTLDEMVPGLPARNMEWIKTVLRTGEPQFGREIVREFPDAPGRRRVFVWDCFPVATKEGAFAIGICLREITELRGLQTELEVKQRELEAAEARLFRLFDEAPAIIAVYQGADHGCIYANERARAELGVDPVGMTLAEMFPTLAEQGELAPYDEALETGRPVISPEMASLARREQKSPDQRYYRRVIQPWTRADGTVAGVMGMSHDVTEIAIARNREAAARREIEEIQDSVPAIIATLDRDGNLLHANKFARALSSDDADGDIGRPLWASSWWPKGKPAEQLRRRLTRAGNGRPQALEAALNAPDGTSRQLDVRIAPSFDADSALTGFYVTALDVSERHRAEARRMILFHELQHRLKNTLALVMAVTDFTEAFTETKPEMATALHGRFDAIRRSMERLTASDWDGLTLHDILSSETETLAVGDRLTLRQQGPDITLDPPRAMSLTLALHELGTNAYRHGALSSPGGHVGISVRTDEPDGQCTLRWVETGGPAPRTDGREGFGSFLLKNLLGRDLGGCVTLDMPPEGLTCSIVFPGAAVDTSPAQGEIDHGQGADSRG